MRDRFYLFAAITLMYACGYQFYFNQQQDEQINEALEGHNKTYKRAVEINNKLKEINYRLGEINNQLRKENEALKHNLIHEQAMYEASKNHAQMLEGQINTISNYYREEIIKVNDELFDLKNTDDVKKIKLSPKREID